MIGGGSNSSSGGVSVGGMVSSLARPYGTVKWTSATLMADYLAGSGLGQLAFDSAVGR